MELVLTYGSNNSTITTEFDTKSYNKKTVYYNNLKYADNSVNLSIPYNQTIQNTIAQYADTNIQAQIKDGTKKIFTGYLRKSFKFSKKQRNQPISLEIVSPNILLDKQITTNETLVGKTVSQIITTLLEKTSYSGTKNIPSPIGTKKATVFFLKEGDNIKDILSNLLFELGYQYDFDESGNIKFYDIFDISGTITQHFNGANSIDEIVVNKKEQEYSGVKVSYKTLNYGSGYIFIDNTGGSGSETSCNIELKPHTYLSSSDADATSYYIEYGSKHGEFVWVTGTPTLLLYVADKETDVGKYYKNVDWLTVSYTNYGNKGELSIYNKTDKTIWIKNLYIQSYHYYSKELATSVSSKGTKFYEYESKYIQGFSTGKSIADNLSAKYADWYGYSDYTITVKSKTNYSLGTLVNVTDVGLTNINGRIIEKVEKLDGSPIQYKIEAISDYTPSTATTTIRQNAIFNTVGMKVDVPTPYEIDCPAIYKAGDTVTFSFYKVESSGRVSTSLYYIYEYSNNGTSWLEGVTGTGSSYTTSAISGPVKIRCRIFEDEESVSPLAEVYSSIVEDGEVIGSAYEIDCPSIYKEGDIVTFNFYEIVNKNRVPATVYYDYEYSANGTSWTDVTEGTGNSYTTSAISGAVKIRCRIFESSTATIPLAEAYSSIVVDGQSASPIYEIDCPSVYKPGDALTFTFYKNENNTRALASVYFSYQTSTNGTSWSTEITGTANTYTSSALTTQKKARCRIFENEEAPLPLAEAYLSIVTDGVNGGHQEYLFAVGAFDLSAEQIRALDWYSTAPETTSSAPCLYMATKWVNG